MPEKDEADTSLTAFEAGNFVSVERPAWWEQELDRLYMSGDIPEPHLSFGADADMSVFVYALEHKRGFYVQFWSPISSEDVWCKDSASLMDLLTTRAQSWLALAAKHTLSDHVEHIRNAVIAYVRHGQGDHVHEVDGTSELDHRRARDRNGSLAKAAEADGA